MLTTNIIPFFFAKYLAGNKIYVPGKRKDRNGNPKSVMNEKFEKCEWLWKSTEMVLILKWKDKRDVVAISKACTPKLKQTTNQHGKKLVKTNVIIDYIANMSGVDQLDQILSNNYFVRKTVRWCKKVGVHILKILLTILTTFVMRCAIWYRVYNLKNVKNTLEAVLILVKLQSETLTLLHACFLRFLNCTNGTKSRNASHLFNKVFCRS